MNEPFWLQLSDAVQHWATALGIVAGGIWAAYRFGIRREKESALGMDLSHSTVAQGGGGYLLFCDVTITNCGKVRISAIGEDAPVYSDKLERLTYAADLLLRRLPSDLPRNTPIGWFGDFAGESPRTDDIELNLLEAFESGSEMDFWMEPGEAYHLSRGAVLAPGLYLALVSFVGSRTGEFWRRLFLIEVPRRVHESAPSAQAAT
jgi:hypothetical protein